MNHTGFLLPLLLIFSASCSPDIQEATAAIVINNIRQVNEVLLQKQTTATIVTNNSRQVNEMLLKPYGITVDLERYVDPACPADTVLTDDYLERFEGIKDLGDLDGDGIREKVFILHAANRCEEGQSYYFSNPLISRIYTTSNCCHLSSLITIGDINEDGKAEVAEYFSSCASRYKAITVYSLNDSLHWKEIVSFPFVLNDSLSIEKDFEKLFKKASRGQLEYLEIQDVSIEGHLIARWRTISI